MSEWISLNDDRKPEHRRTILVSVVYVRYHENEDGSTYEEEGSEVAMGEYVGANGDIPGYFDSYSGPHGDNWWITHWMPLPKPAGDQP